MVCMGPVEGYAWVGLKAVTSLGTLVMIHYNLDGFLHIDPHCADILHLALLPTVIVKSEA